MNQHAAAALFVVGIWWLSTGVVLRMVWLRRSTFRLSIAIFSVLAVAALSGLVWSSRVASPLAAYVGFGCAIVVWGWHELLFLLGVITGPRRIPCPPDSAGWERFKSATATVIHHELALAGTMLAVAALSSGAPNQVGVWTFLVLWIMRLSAKLNVYLGVRNLSEQFVPEHLRYLLSYFRRARMNALMPFSVLVGSAVVAWLVHTTLAENATPFVIAGRSLVASILALAVVEHVLLSLPLPDSLLWSWAIRSKRGQSSEVLQDLPAEVQ